MDSLINSQFGLVHTADFPSDFSFRYNLSFRATQNLDITTERRFLLIPMIAFMNKNMMEKSVEKSVQKDAV